MRYFIQGTIPKVGDILVERYFYFVGKGIWTQNYADLLVYDDKYEADVRCLTILENPNNLTGGKVYTVEVLDEKRYFTAKLKGKE